MAITYKWEVSQMSAYVEAEGKDNVIYTVQWVYRGSEESEGKIYSSANIGSQDYTYVAGTPFVPYENTEAFEGIVIGWLETSLDVPAMEANIALAIEAKIKPVEESLLFTWQDE
jgi:hypothetical protein|tara:strand:+ start:129 stop:470 length:342 start_codon:yes stop_codon:yes gene_type:complete